MKEWDIKMKKEGCSEEYLGTVVAESPKRAIELFFEPEEIELDSKNHLLVIEKDVPSNVYSYQNGKLEKI